MIYNNKNVATHALTIEALPAGIYIVQAGNATKKLAISR
jgi:hypothetical protein